MSAQTLLTLLTYLLTDGEDNGDDWSYQIKVSSVQFADNIGINISTLSRQNSQDTKATYVKRAER